MAQSHTSFRVEVYVKNETMKLLHSVWCDQLLRYHSDACWAEEPREVLDRMGGSRRGDEGGNSRGLASYGANVLREAEAAEALRRIQNISQRFVCMYIDKL